MNTENRPEFIICSDKDLQTYWEAVLESIGSMRFYDTHPQILQYFAQNSENLSNNVVLLKGDKDGADSANKLLQYQNLGLRFIIHTPCIYSPTLQNLKGTGIIFIDPFAYKDIGSISRRIEQLIYFNYKNDRRKAA